MERFSPPPAGRPPLGRCAGFAAAIIAIIACGSLAMVASTTRNEAVAAPSTPNQQSPLWISLSPLTEDRQLMVVIDPATRSAAIYHLDAAAGTLSLKSTRDLRWDLMIGEFNVQEPSPATLKRMLEAPVTGRPAGEKTQP